MNSIEQNTRTVKTIATSLGFSYVGISKAERLDQAARNLEDWLNHGFHGKMSYMENHFEKRVDPTKLVPGAKSVISLLYNYYPDAAPDNPDAPKVSRYAYGNDYHFVIKEKLKYFLSELQSIVGQVDGRCFVDSAPVMEREWAEKAGLGWNGKNTLLINPRAGSYFFLAELIIDLPLESDTPIRDYCGTCSKCIEACPTDAISEKGYVLDSSRCISYLTIELKDAISDEFSDKMENWIFGCDICQEVCPWNRFSSKHNEEAFEPDPQLMAMNENDWKELTKEVFSKLFKKSAVKRTKYEGLRRNIRFVLDDKQ